MLAVLTIELSTMFQYVLIGTEHICLLYIILLILLHGLYNTVSCCYPVAILTVSLPGNMYIYIYIYHTINRLIDILYILQYLIING